MLLKSNWIGLVLISCLKGHTKSSSNKKDYVSMPNEKKTNYGANFWLKKSFWEYSQPLITPLYYANFPSKVTFWQKWSHCRSYLELCEQPQSAPSLVNRTDPLWTRWFVHRFYVWLYIPFGCFWFWV